MKLLYVIFTLNSFQRLYFLLLFFHYTSYDFLLKSTSLVIVKYTLISTLSVSSLRFRLDFRPIILFKNRFTLRSSEVQDCQLRRSQVLIPPKSLKNVLVPREKIIELFCMLNFNFQVPRVGFEATHFPKEKNRFEWFRSIQSCS